jgi:uncharacterized protein YcfL
MNKPIIATLAVFLLAGCSYASTDPTKLDAVAVGNTCAAARNETSAAVACSNPDKQKFYHALLTFLMRTNSHD